MTAPPSDDRQRSPSDSPLPDRVEADPGESAAQEPAGTSLSVATEPRRWSARQVTAAGSAGIALAVLALLIPFPFRGRLFEGMTDALHSPSFAALTLLALQWARWAGKRSWPSCGLVVLAVIAAGGLLEYLQSFSGRTPSLHDMVANACGATAGGLLHLRWFTGRRSASRLPLLLAAVLLAAGMASGIRLMADAIQQSRAFPRLASFESSAELDRWFRKSARLTRSRRYASQGLWSGHLEIAPGDYPGVGMFQMPADWSDYRFLRFHVVGAFADGEVDSDETIQLEIGIADRHFYRRDEDCYRGVFALTPGTPYEISIPLSSIAHGPQQRRLDLSQVRMLEMHVADDDLPAELWLDDVRLE